MNVGIHAMQLTPKQNVMKQKLENEVDIIGKVTEFF
jgi:hypothetical protein